MFGAAAGVVDEDEKMSSDEEISVNFSATDIQRVQHYDGLSSRPRDLLELDMVMARKPTIEFHNGTIFLYDKSFTDPENAHSLAVAINGNSNITQVTLWDCVLSTKERDISSLRNFLVTLAQSPYLREMEINARELNDQAAAEVANYLRTESSLTTFCLRNVGLLSNQGAETLGAAIQQASNSLVRLQFVHITLADSASAPLIMGAAQKRHLALRACDLSKTMAEKLASLLSETASLAELTLSGHHSDEVPAILGPALIANAIRDFPLTRFAYCYAHLLGESAEQLFHALPQTEIIELDLSHTPLDQNGLQALAAYLRSPTCKLLSLKLSRVNLGNEGAKIILDAVAQNRSLRYLDLSYCGITDGAIVARMLIHNTTLQSLNLATRMIEEMQFLGKELGDEERATRNGCLNFITYLALGLAHNNTLQRLNAESRFFSPREAIVLAAAVSTNHTLVEVVGFPEFYYGLIEPYIKRNRQHLKAQLTWQTAASLLASFKTNAGHIFCDYLIDLLPDIVDLARDEQLQPVEVADSLPVRDKTRLAKLSKTIFFTRHVAKDFQQAPKAAEQKSSSPETLRGEKLLNLVEVIYAELNKLQVSCKYKEQIELIQCVFYTVLPKLFERKPNGQFSLQTVYDFLTYHHSKHAFSLAEALQIKFISIKKYLGPFLLGGTIDGIPAEQVTPVGRWLKKQSGIDLTLLDPGKDDRKPPYEEAKQDEEKAQQDLDKIIFEVYLTTPEETSQQKSSKKTVTQDERHPITRISHPLGLTFTYADVIRQEHGLVVLVNHPTPWGQAVQQRAQELEPAHEAEAEAPAPVASAAALRQ